MKPTPYRFQALLSAIPDLVFLFNREGICLDLKVPPGIVAALPKRLIGKPIQKMGLSEADTERALEKFALAFSDGPQRFECTLNNSWFSGRYEVGISAVSQLEAIVAVRDITAHREMEATLERIILHDPLTGLPNKHFLERRFEQAQKTPFLKDAEAALLYIDIGRFKSVNDTLGHSHGDAVLSEVAERLRDVVRARDIVARTSGDEFAVFLAASDEPATIRVAERLLKVLSEPFHRGRYIFNLGASIGITTFPIHDKGFAEIMRRAEMAMYRAKHSGGGIHFYDPEADRRMQEKTWLEQELRVALREGQFSLYFQPIIDLKLAAPMAAEVLLRWEHQERGMISPGVFIPVAEETGLITELDRWVLKTALQQAKKAELAIAINVSPMSLKDSSLVSYIAACLTETRFDPEHLCIEITEQVLARPEQTLATIDALHAQGIQIAVDDFGTGYSSLAYLSQYPLDILKIDRGFVMTLETDPKMQTIARSIIRLAHSLNLIALAEGIETQGQLDWLEAEGCQLAQGFYLGRPMPIELFQEKQAQFSLPLNSTSR